MNLATLWSLFERDRVREREGEMTEIESVVAVVGVVVANDEIKSVSQNLSRKLHPTQS